MLRRESAQKNSIVDHSENYWQSFDGIKLYTQTWASNATPRGVILLVHGLGEHGGRYADWAKKLASEAYIVSAFDHRGHGKSPGKRGYISRYEKVLEDIGAFIDQLRKEYPSLPVFLYGQSLGGNFVLNYAIQNKQPVDGMIVSSPWLELEHKPLNLLLQAVSFISNFFPRLLVWNRVKPEDLSRDLRVVHNYRTDPLVHDRISLRLFRESYEAGLKASTSIYKINVPLLIMHGTEDNLTSCKASRKFVQNASSKTKFVEWEGSYHELHNDLDREKVFAVIKGWLDHYANPETRQNA